jgi:hypothetical protein
MTPTIIIGIIYKSIPKAGGSSKPEGGGGIGLHKAVVVPAMVKNNVIKIILYRINVFIFFIIAIKIQFVNFVLGFCFYIKTEKYGSLYVR